MGYTPAQNDPFIELMRPPPDETPAQLMARRKRELDAQRISDKIDEQIKKERALSKKEKTVTKVLLLGQAESDFRMRYAPEEWQRERNGWRAVVQLNIVRSISLILRVVEAELNGEPLSGDIEGEENQAPIDDIGDTEAVKFTDWHQLLMIRLAPLRGVELELKKKLGVDNYMPVRHVSRATPFDDGPQTGNDRALQAQEFSVRSWQDILDPGTRKLQNIDVSTALDAITATIASCKDDMKALWNDKAIRFALHRRRIRLPDSAGFFLNDLDRIATRDYTVDDNDIVRARLRTVGVQEYQLMFDHGPWDNPKIGKSNGWEWRIYDVGGCRTLRAAWLPYFDNVNVIIFLTPVSVFDETLWEDPTVNRLQDSIGLWTSICSSKLLAKAQLIHFLNKCDLLHRKLKRGVQLQNYLASYGERPNDVSSAIKYLRDKFRDIQKKRSPAPRTPYIYPTTVTDTEATAITLESVRDGVLRENLTTSQLI
ncbi:hypothetical protein AMATHDRAFT_137279 [Amanita thiersii Skay4041]|uniref:G-alpha-domain-containing protein n=1 Tax=Amanita thiersii Skay4041 TaxID=703135 RepID=A0A2A9NYB2_9AGAR|nr:hypothetical protein AMATHDRAFT_137279 [Amanita thiersii Skay4041]